MNFAWSKIIAEIYYFIKLFVMLQLKQYDIIDLVSMTENLSESPMLENIHILQALKNIQGESMRIAL